jgi:predicted Zn finger-like uncharacterized protein
VVVICPKCKTKLKVDEEKLTPGGARFKCPKCGTILLVKKPAPAPPKPIDNIKVLIAHSNPSIANEITALLNQTGYQTITASDGIEAMVKALKELPFLAVLEVNLPKIYGFEVSKRLKQRPETRTMKFIMVSSPHDKTRYKREPESLYEADAHIEDYHVSEILIQTVSNLRGQPTEKKETVIEKPEIRKPETKEPEVKLEEKIEKPVIDDEGIARAKRLARTIVSDIYLYNTAKAEESIKNNSFFSAFASEIKEGLKLYESRIPPEIRSQGDFFKSIINEFIENKKKNL